ncbi:FKBP-type peptidyl-prolyl cis-trans isomerase [Sediminitomix flava]|uniref:peptidylprolyl isomerase n=1 Tax=Sediminitomix flava TaxID=379075 RepID=A0A315Z5P5_SEDFL|nr:FKBP-type peptidyl-prolyl cis-trans isomerase [Sediminitomix flava]PWJ39228.1 FKBP-type peptidyl-prolyl cis-trans isomerase [Sediminitomix flava]
MNWRKKILWSACVASLGLYTACSSSEESGETSAGHKYKRIIAAENKGVVDSLLVKPKSNTYVSYRGEVVNAKDSVLAEFGYMYDMPSFTPIRNAESPRGLEEILVLGAQGDSLVMNTTAGDMMFRGLDPQDELELRVRLLKVYDDVKVVRAEADSLRKIAMEKRESFMEERYEEEKASIEEYAKANNLELLQAENGTYYVITEQGNGGKYTEGETAVMNYRGTLLESGKEFDNSYDRGESFKFKPGKKQVIAGWDAVVPLLDEGSKAIILIPSKLGYQDRVSPTIPANATLKFEVEVVGFMDDVELEEQRLKDMEARVQKEKADLVAYVKDNSLTSTKTESGLQYVITEEGSGEYPQVGDTVVVHYTGTLLNGKKFDSSLDRNETFEFALGQGRVIKGWDEGIALMKKGSKATLLIPSNLGYGERGAGADIPPYSPLKFDVELVDVKKAK